MAWSGVIGNVDVKVVSKHICRTLPTDRVRLPLYFSRLRIFCTSGSAALRLAAKELAFAKHRSYFNFYVCPPALFNF